MQTINLFLNNKNIKKILKQTDLFLDATKPADTEIFRKIIEISMQNCLWNGVCGLS